MIKRTSLRSQVREALLERMRSASTTPGETINEVQLAAELGVSRTPLREALISLETEGQIASEAGRGFRFLPLSITELDELSPIIATLEGLALELSPIDELIALGHQLDALASEFPDDVAEHRLISERDDAWHGLMISACPNGRLLDVITTTRQAIHRYESLLIPDEAMIERQVEEHQRIARHLMAGNVPEAQAALRDNWSNGVRHLADAMPTDRAS